MSFFKQMRLQKSISSNRRRLIRLTDKALDETITPKEEMEFEKLSNTISNQLAELKALQDADKN